MINEKMNLLSNKLTQQNFKNIHTYKHTHIYFFYVTVRLRKLKSDFTIKLRLFIVIFCYSYQHEYGNLFKYLIYILIYRSIFLRRYFVSF